MTYGELKRRLRRFGVKLVRQGSNHEIWQNPANGQRTQIPLHRGEVPNGTPHGILRQLGLRLEELP